MYQTSVGKLEGSDEPLVALERHALAERIAGGGTVPKVAIPVPQIQRPLLKEAKRQPYVPVHVIVVNVRNPSCITRVVARLVADKGAESRSEHANLRQNLREAGFECPYRAGLILIIRRVEDRTAQRAVLPDLA